MESDHSTSSDDSEDSTNFSSKMSIKSNNKKEKSSNRDTTNSDSIQNLDEVLHVHFSESSVSRRLFDESGKNTTRLWSGGRKLHRAPAFHNRGELKKLFRSPTQPEEEMNIIPYDPNHIFTGHVNSWPEIDDNKNIVSETSKDIKNGKKYSSNIDKYLILQPGSIVPRTSYKVYDLMGHFKSYFYGNEKPVLNLQPRNIRVKFPDEIVEKADIHGDRAGKDREVTKSEYVPRRRQKIRKVFDQKRGRTIIDPEIRDDVDSNHETGGCCEFFIQNFLFAGGSSHNINGTSSEHIAPKKLTQKYRKASNRFGSNLDIAAEFIDGNMKSIRGSEDIIYFPIDSSEVKEKINHVCAKLWLCVFGIHHLFQVNEQNGGIPTKIEFEELVTKLEQLSMNAERMAEKAIIFSNYLHEYGKEVLGLLAKTGKTLGIKLDKNVAKPIKKRDGLHILKIKEGKEKDNTNTIFKIVTREKSNVNVNNLRWKNFNQHSKEFRLTVLEDLAECTYESIHELRSFLRFISEDVVNGKFEDEDPPFLAIITLLDDLIKYFLSSSQTTKQHLESITDVMTQFIGDTKEFFIRTENVLIKMVEIRDMVQLCYDYMKEQYAVDIATYLPGTKAFTNKEDETKSCCWGCIHCCKFQSKKFHYKVEDFQHTVYKEILSLQWVSASTVELILKPADAYEKKDEKMDLELRFAEPIDIIPEDDTFEFQDMGSSIPSIYNSAVSSMEDFTTSSLENIEASKTRSLLVHPLVVDKDKKRFELPVNQTVMGTVKTLLSSETDITIVPRGGLSSHRLGTLSSFRINPQQLQPILKVKSGIIPHVDTIGPPLKKSNIDILKLQPAPDELTKEKMKLSLDKIIPEKKKHAGNNMSIPVNKNASLIKVKDTAVNRTDRPEKKDQMEKKDSVDKNDPWETKDPQHKKSPPAPPLQ